MSFFGFDASIPPEKAEATKVENPHGNKRKGMNKKSNQRPPTPNPNPNRNLTLQSELDGDALDELLEKKYAHGLEFGSEDEDFKTSMLLQNDNSELNDETFKIELEDGDFDFGNQPAKQSLLSSSSTRQPPNQVPVFPQPAHQPHPSGYNQRQQTMSLDQVEAQMHGDGRGLGRGGGIPPNGFPPSHSNQPNLMMNAGLMNRPLLSQMPPPIMNQMFGGGGGVPMRPSIIPPNQQGVPFRQPPPPTSQQAFMMRPPPQQMGHPFPPPLHPHMMAPPPQPIVIDGISVTPVEISNQEKDMIFAKLQVIQPMFMHIDTLMNTIYKIGGEKESENLRRLNDVKNILRVQLELINRGIFVMRHDTVLQIHGSLLQFFQYGESVMKNATEQTAQPLQNRPPSPKRVPSPSQSLSSQSLSSQPSPSQPSPGQPLSRQVSPSQHSPRQYSPRQTLPSQHSPRRTSSSIEPEGRDVVETRHDDTCHPTQPITPPFSKKSLKVIKKKKEGEGEGEGGIQFDTNEFPALGQGSIHLGSERGGQGGAGSMIGTFSSEGKSREPMIRMAARGNQKQRREERLKQERMGGGTSGLDYDDSSVSLEEHMIPKEERHDGVMRKHEKELIAKIQISQLVSDDPFKDDYYFQMRSLKKKKDQEEQEGGGLTFLGKGVGGGKLGGGGKMKKKGVKWQISAGQLVQGKTGAALSNQMQQQMKRLIESRRALKPREGNLSLEGALGKIAVKSNRAPKQALEVAPPPPSSSANQLLSNTLLSLADLKCAENIFDAILTLEEFTRKKVPEKEDAKEKWNAEKIDLVNELWRCMAPSDDIPLTTPHPLVCSLNHLKGLQAANRGLNILDTKQNLGFFSIMFKRLECLNVCNYTLGEESEKVELFMTHILPVFTTIITEAEMGVLLVLMRIVLERHNLIWLASCRVGLVLLTMILSRAEMVKQNVAATFTGEEGEGDGQGVSDAESSMWEEIYSFLFSSFQGQFAELFKTDTLPDDQVYVWQFLSAMAVGASGIEQQKILVTEMRDNIIQTAKTNHPKALENVNLFLNALGLNITASQLAAMSG